jgi:hypothetical protein
LTPLAMWGKSAGFSATTTTLRTYAHLFKKDHGAVGAAIENTHFSCKRAITQGAPYCCVSARPLLSGAKSGANF